MSFRLGLAQCKHPEDGDPVRLVEQFSKSAKEKGVDVLVFPESLMTPYEKERGAFLKEAQTSDGHFSHSICNIAKDYGIWLLYTMNESSFEEKPFNTAILADSTGSKKLVYRKVHLFDSSKTKESDRMMAGCALPEPVNSPYCTMGVGICYDLRFPEYARYSALHGAQLLLYPAAWVDGEHKIEQWKSLLKARAIENEIFVAGVSRCDEGYIGSSLVVNPFGEVIAEAGRNEELLVAEIDLGCVDTMRSSIPVFSHRRTDLY